MHLPSFSLLHCRKNRLQIPTLCVHSLGRVSCPYGETGSLTKFTLPAQSPPSRQGCPWTTASACWVKHFLHTMKQPACFTGNPGKESLGKELIGRWEGEEGRPSVYIHTCIRVLQQLYTPHTSIYKPIVHTLTQCLYTTHTSTCTHTYTTASVYTRVYTNHTYTQI